MDETTRLNNIKALLQLKSNLNPHQCQFSDVNENSPERALVIGLDFGTAFTKVVIGDGSDHYVVPFYSNDSDVTALLPGLVSVMEGGECLLGEQEFAISKVGDLKISLIDRMVDDKKEAFVVIFLALVLQRTRKWLIAEKADIFKNYRLDWYVNIGLPTDSYHDEDLNITYRKLLSAAWMLSVIPEAVSLGAALEVMTNPDSYLAKYTNIEFLEAEKVEVFPEFAAQVAGYVRSSQKRKDLHLLIDVGAGTVDITTFNVHFSDDDDEYAYPIFKRVVVKMGSVYLMRERQRFLGRPVIWNSFDPIPSDETFSVENNVDLQDLKNWNRDFQADLMEEVKKVLKYTKEKRYRQSRHWEEGIPTFLCGGGGQSILYQSVIDFVRNKMPSYRVDKKELPTPENLIFPIEINQKAYDRLSVAYGLSYDAFDLGQIKREQDIDDDEVPDVLESDYTDRYIGPESL